MRRHSATRAVRDASHELRIAEDEDGPLPVVDVYILENGREVLGLTFKGLLPHVAVIRSACARLPC